MLWLIYLNSTNKRTGIMTIFKKHKKLFLSLSIISLFSSSVLAGEVVNITSKDLTDQNAKEETVKFLFADGLMKMTTDEDSEMIFNSDAQNMTVITHSDKSYMILDKSFASDVKSEMEKAMEEALAQVPPEQRAMVEKMMKQRMPNMENQAPKVEMPEIDIRETSRDDTVNGYDCKYYEQFRNDQKESEYCVASWSELEVGNNIQTSFKNMSEFMKGFLEEIQKISPVQMNDNPFAQMEEMEGFPVLSRQFSNGKATQESILSSIEEQDIDASEFSAPDGYKKRDMMGR